MSALSIRRIREPDLEFCDELRALVGWNQRREDWAVFLRLTPDGCFIAELDGGPAGTVTTIDYEQTIGWIGMLIVHPARRGSGVGKRLLERAVEHLQDRKVRTIKLDATPQGEPLYTRMGFQSEGRITRWIAQSSPGSAHDRSRQIRDFERGDLNGIIRADENAFGASRATLLGDIQKEALATRVLRASGDGLGFAMLRAGSTANYLGPVIARDLESARGLVPATTARQDSRPVIWDLPERPGRESLASEFGFKPQRTLTRMRLGPKTEGAIEHYWGLVDPACG